MADLNPTQQAAIERAEVGREDVTRVLLRAIEKEEYPMRMFPEFYAHRVTKALIKAGIIEKETPTDEEH